MKGLLQATQLDANSPSAWIELAHYYYAVEDDPASAVSAFDRTLELCQGFLQNALAGKARALLEMGREKEGLACLGDLFRLLPNGKPKTIPDVSALLEEFLATFAKKGKEMAS